MAPKAQHSIPTTWEENPLKVYLSGPVLKGEDYVHSVSWRQVAEETFRDYDWDVLNPIADSLYYDDAYKDLIVDRDMMMLNECDIVVVNWLDKVNTVGTPMEVYHAWMLGKPVIWFGDTIPGCNALDDNPWVIRHNCLAHVKLFTIENLMDVIEWFDFPSSDTRYIEINRSNPIYDGDPSRLGGFSGA